MAEHFLEEQLERIQNMTEQISRVRSRAVELSQEFERVRAMMRQQHTLREPHDHAHPQADRHAPHAPRRRRR
jgi:methylthioribose-1-phosphate isomerase